MGALTLDLLFKKHIAGLKMGHERLVNTEQKLVSLNAALQ